MSWMDLLRMSSGNLKRRKLRTFLTVLGVIIGTASIVVMISLGLGLQQSMYEQIEQSGGLTSIRVYGGDMMTDMSGSSDGEEKQITDEVIEQLKKIENVDCVSPVLSLSTIMMKGKYEGYIELQGMTREALESQNIPLASGTLPKENGAELEIVAGNMLSTNFYEKSSGKGYWDLGEDFDIDFKKDTFFTILDQDGYWESQEQGGFGMEAGEEAQKPKGPVKKYILKACGVVEGGPEDYNTHSYNAYCDLDTLKTVLKKEFAGRAIPGQPTTKSGKPYNYFVYSSAYVKVNDFQNMEAVSAAIRELGFQVESNAEFMESMKSQNMIVQAVLGGIGAVSLLVAAIGIANTMMMSIYERTKEIGVIKVLGCSLKNIRQMFLMEAGFIGFLGGVIGNILSIIISLIINSVTGSLGESMGFGTTGISYIPFWLVLLSTAFAVFVGMAAGYFPALRAMRLSPLAAIRNE